MYRSARKLTIIVRLARRARAGSHVLQAFAVMLGARPSLGGQGIVSDQAPQAYYTVDKAFPHGPCPHGATHVAICPFLHVACHTPDSNSNTHQRHSPAHSGLITALALGLQDAARGTEDGL